MYAAARRLSLANSVPLKLDIDTGFRGDFFRREFGLKHFKIQVEKATAWEAYNYPFARLIRKLSKTTSRLLPIEKRRYLVEESHQFDPRILDLKIKRRVYMEGYWQSEKYFKDIEAQLRDDLRIITPHDTVNVEMARKIQGCTSVCVHVRHFSGVPQSRDDKPLDVGPSSCVQSLESGYYHKAMEEIARQIPDAHFFCFADYFPWARDKIRTPNSITFVDLNNGEEKNYEDLWLMSLCKHHIVANSSFGWWGSWLCDHPGQIVYAPDPVKWHSNGEISEIVPSAWRII